MNHNTNQQFSNPESQLKSGIATIVAEPIDRDAIERVKMRAKQLAAKADLESNTIRPATIEKKRSHQPSRLKSRLWMSAIAASLASAFGATFLFSGSDSAFADAVQRLRTIKNISFAMTITVESESPELGSKQNFTDLQKHNVYAMADGRVRIESQDGIMLFNSNDGKFFINHAEQEFSHLESPKDFDQIEELSFNYLDWFESLRSKRIKPVEELGKKTLHGIESEGFLVKDDGSEITIWVDPNTDHLVQVELEQSEKQPNFTILVSMVMHEFEYDSDLEDSIFEFKPPAGYNRVDFENPPNDLTTEQGFIDGLHAFVEQADGKFPESLDASSLVVMPSGESVSEKVMTSAIGVQTFVMLSNEHQYLGAGKNQSDDRSIVFWYRESDTNKLRAVYNDFTAAEIQENQLP